MKSLYVLAPDPRLICKGPVATSLASLGMNTGNLAFTHGLLNLLDRRELNNAIFLGYFNKNSNYNLSPQSKVLIPLANHIDVNRNLKHLGEFLVGLKNSCIDYFIFGLGSQFSDDEMIEQCVCSLKEKSDFKVFAEGLAGAKALTVRGEKTQKILNEFGVASQNLGCPSLFLNSTNRHLGELIDLKLKDLKLLADESINSVPIKISVSTLKDQKLVLSSRYMSLEKNLYEIKKSEAVYVHQTAHRNGSMPITGAMYSDLERADADMLSVKEIFSEHKDRPSRMFFSSSSWLSYFFEENISLNIGMRMHGNMFAIGAGVPGITIPIDARMQEIVKAMNLPFLPLDDAMRIDNLNIINLLENVRFVPSLFDSKRRLLAQEYLEIFNRNGIGSSSELRFLVGGY